MSHVQDSNLAIASYDMSKFFLSYAGGTAYSNAYFGAGSGPIFLDDVQCGSTSSQLLECPSRPILSHNCLHSADAGVGCEGVLCNWKYSKKFPEFIIKLFLT